jgi:hypothetical protein
MSACFKVSLEVPGEIFNGSLIITFCRHNSTRQRFGLELSNQTQRFFRQNQGCQMAHFQTKTPNLGKFWRVSQWKMLVHFMTIWSILMSIYEYLVDIVLFWYVVRRKNLATLV